MAEDLIEQLRLLPAHLEVIAEPQPAPAKKATKRHIEGRRFVLCERDALIAAAAAVGEQKLVVWLYLMFETKLRGNNTLAVSNLALQKWGVTARAKREALSRLEKAGLITVQRAGKRSPTVTVLVGKAAR